MGPMPDTTPNIALPFLFAAQAQKHVTLNESLLRLDALVQLTVLDRDLAAPPGSPADGDRYIIASGASGAWVGQGPGTIAAWQDGAWTFIPPREGWLAWVADEDTMLAWSGTQWISAAASGPLQNVPLLGVNATADTTNRLAVAAPATLLNNAGAGHQLKINKAGAGDTASFLFQTGFSGRAELGTAGSDDLAIKVSADGSTWREALLVERASGRVALPLTPPAINLLVNGDFAINQRVFAGGALSAGAYGFDRWKAHTAGCDIVAATASSVTTVTIASGTIVQVVEAGFWPALQGKSLTLSVEDLTGGSLAVEVGSQSGTITPGSGRRGVALTLGAGETGNVTVRLAPASSAVSFKRVQLELGIIPTAWSPRALALEHLLCARYFYKTNRLTHVPGSTDLRGRLSHVDASSATTAKLELSRPFHVHMRTLPTITWYSPSTGTPGKIFQHTGSVEHDVVATWYTSHAWSGYPSIAAGAGGAGQLWSAHMSADAEL